MDAIDRAGVDTGRVLGADARFRNNVSHSFLQGRGLKGLRVG
jgi:hypothetical protein